MGHQDQGSEVKQHSQGKDEGWRARTVKEKHKFKVLEEVYVKGERGMDGPFKISDCLPNNQYRLCDKDDAPVEDNKIFEESELKKA